MTIAHRRYSDGSSDRYITFPILNEAFWNESNDALLRGFAAQKEGLTGAEAERRLVRYGPNLSVLNIRRSLIIKFGRRIAEPLIAILLIAALISGAVGDWQSLIVIVLIVLFSIALDVFSGAKGGEHC
jgi:Mg2+-importing ATPase